MLATTASGDIVYRGKVPTELAAPGAGGIVRFEAPPGKLDMRLTIEGDGTGTLDSDDRELVVPDLTAPEVMLSTPQVWFARNAREFTALTAGAPPAPTATRDFRRTDRLLVRFDAFAPANAATTVTARLLNQQGTKMMRRPGDRARRRRATVRDRSAARQSRGGPVSARDHRNGEGHKPVTELVAVPASVRQHRTSRRTSAACALYFATRTFRASCVTVATRLIATM